MRRLAELVRDLPRRLGYFEGPWLASWLRKRWVLLRHPHATIRFGRGVYLGPGFSLHMPFGGTFEAGDGTEFRRGFRAEVGPEGRISIGRSCVFTYYVLMQCSTSIDVEDRVMFGQSSMVVDGNHRFRELDRPMLEQGYDFRPIRLEEDATITTKCTVIANVGRRAFVGANSVVTRDLPPYTVCTGAPARPVDYFGPPGSEPPELARSEEPEPAG
jgi:acetyltransferase-like isoleucine patch superfamily enzyme